MARGRLAASMARPHRTAGLLFLFVWFGVTLSSGTNPIDGDATLMCVSASEFTRNGSLALPTALRDDMVHAPGGGYYTNYPLLAILNCVPAEGLRSGAKYLGLEHSPLRHLIVGAWPAAVAALLSMLFFYLALAIGIPARGSLLGAIALIFTTPHWVYGRLLYSENLQAVTVVAACLCWLAPARRMRAWQLLVAGFVLGLCVHAKTPLAVMVVAVLAQQVALWVNARTFRLYALARPAFLATLGGMPLLVLFLWYNYVRFGDAMTLGYANARAETIGFGTPLGTGLFGLLLSPGKSIFVYAPLLLLAFGGWRRFIARTQAQAWLFLLPAALVFILMAKWWAWGGDWAWGPRLVLPVVPLLFLLVLFSARRALLAGVLAIAGFAINVLGLLVDHSHYLHVVLQTLRPSILGGPAMTPIRDDLAVVHFVPEFSPPLGHYWIVRQILKGSWSETDWFPWKSIGLPGWNLQMDPRPADGFNIWFDGSTESWVALIIISFAWVGLAIGLWLSMRDPPSHIG